MSARGGPGWLLCAFSAAATQLSTAQPRGARAFMMQNANERARTCTPARHSVRLAAPLPNTSWPACCAHTCIAASSSAPASQCAWRASSAATSSRRMPGSPSTAASRRRASPDDSAGCCAQQACPTSAALLVRTKMTSSKHSIGGLEPCRRKAPSTHAKAPESSLMHHGTPLNQGAALQRHARQQS